MPGVQGLNCNAQVNLLEHQLWHKLWQYLGHEDQDTLWQLCGKKTDMMMPTLYIQLLARYLGTQVPPEVYIARNNVRLCPNCGRIHLHLNREVCEITTWAIHVELVFLHNLKVAADNYIHNHALFTQALPSTSSLSVPGPSNSRSLAKHLSLWPLTDLGVNHHH
jgi:hypothetical protein